MEKNVLIGETNDFDTMEIIRSLSELERYEDIECKYLGGLHVLIRFDHLARGLGVDVVLEGFSGVFSEVFM